MANNQNVSAGINPVRTKSSFHGITEEIHIDDIVFSLLEDQKRLDSKFLFDMTGVRLFQEICLLSEYYPSRVGLQILKKSVIPSLPDYRDIEIIAIGSGEYMKIKTLIQALHVKQSRILRFIPLDFTEAAIESTSNPLRDLFPQLNITAMRADLTRPLNLYDSECPRIFCLFGGTPGNTEDFKTTTLLQSIKLNMNHNDILLAGFDRKKSVRIMEKAYNDSKGLMAMFNKNILPVVNRIARSGIDPDNFTHHAFYNPARSRIEMHLKATSDLNLHLRKAGLILGMCRGESILTAASKKYEPDDIDDLAESTGLKINRLYSDDKNWFSIAELRIKS